MPRSLLGRGGNDGKYYFKSKNPAGLRNAEFAAQMFDYIAHVFYAVAVLVAFGLACRRNIGRGRAIVYALYFDAAAQTRHG